MYTDLIAIGDGTVIGRARSVRLPRHDGVSPDPRPVTLGSRCSSRRRPCAGHPGASISDSAQLGHTSSLHAGQAVPPRAHWRLARAADRHRHYRTCRSSRSRGCAGSCSQSCCCCSHLRARACDRGGAAGPESGRCCC
ncbi:hypothetical protein HBB16_18205 [Pseudonocardia sp. MCCB 268]|nr:hypothetical protein [Pseudonocardia cytotoxica]